MKLAVVRLPDHVECELIIRAVEKQPRVIIIRGKQLVVLSALLLCASVLFATKPFASKEAKFTPAPLAATLVEPPAPAVSPVEHRPMAASFDGSRSLKAGDLVIMDGTNAPKIRQITAAPNETILLRRGNALHALYLLGDSGYVVLANNESWLVHSGQIRATVAPMTLVSAF